MCQLFNATRNKITSRTEDEGFSIDVDDWSKDEEDWTFPITYIQGARCRPKAGTRIEITKLRPEIALRVKSGSFMGTLFDRIQSTYGLFLDRYVDIIVNSQKLQPRPIPFGGSDEVIPAVERFERDFGSGLVKVTLVAGLGVRTWKAELAGWYALCNGRIVLAANKDTLTGWGDGMASFQPKYRGFVGAAFYYSSNPYVLPWTTTKYGLNQEARIYQETRKRMEAVTRPVLRFLDDFYPSTSGDRELPEMRAVGERIKAIDIRKVASTKDPSQFEARPKARPSRTTVRIQYDAETKDVDLIKRTLGKRSWSARRIGQHTFKYFLEMECGEGD